MVCLGFEPRPQTNPPSYGAPPIDWKCSSQSKLTFFIIIQSKRTIVMLI